MRIIKCSPSTALTAVRADYPTLELSLCWATVLCSECTVQVSDDSVIRNAEFPCSVARFSLGKLGPARLPGSFTTRQSVSAKPE